MRQTQEQIDKIIQSDLNRMSKQLLHFFEKYHSQINEKDVEKFNALWTKIYTHLE